MLFCSFCTTSIIAVGFVCLLLLFFTAPETSCEIVQVLYLVGCLEAFLFYPRHTHSFLFIYF